MHKLRGLLYLTFRELWAKKIIVGLFIVSTLAWVMLMLFMNVEEVEGGVSMVRLFGSDPVASSEGGVPTPGDGAVQVEIDTSDTPGDSPARDSIAATSPDGGVAAGDSAQVDAEMARQEREQAQRQAQQQRSSMIPSFAQLTMAAQLVVSQAAYWIIIILGLFSAAPLFARLLESGHVDLLLSKPMTRVQLFSGHVLGVLLMVLALGTYLFGAVWLILSIKLDVWNARFLFSIAVLVGSFAVLYGVVALVTIWTESTALALIVAYGVIFVSIFLAPHQWIYTSLNATGDFFYGALYYVVPNFAEVGYVAAQLLDKNSAVTLWDAVGSTAAVGALLYLASGFLFTRRDF